MRHKKRIIFSAIFLLSFLFGFTLPLTAEEFKVIRSFSGLKDVTKFIECDSVNVDLSGTSSREEMAKEVGVKVLRREATHGDPSVGIAYILDYITNQKGRWFLYYTWEYTSFLKEGKKTGKFFNLKIDLEDKTVIYEGRIDFQYSGPAPKY